MMHSTIVPLNPTNSDREPSKANLGHPETNAIKVRKKPLQHRKKVPFLTILPFEWNERQQLYVFSEISA